MIKLLVGTPAYNSMVHTDYVHSVIGFSTIKDVSVSILTIGNESLITRARNKIFSLFIRSNCDYLLFLDADIGFPKQELIKLLSHNKDVIGAPVRLKDPQRMVFNYGRILDDSSHPLLEVDRVGTAVMLISRKLALDVVAFCKEKGWVYRNNPIYSRGNREALDDYEIYDAFKVGTINGEYLSEDYFFCSLVKDLGYKIFVDVSCKTIHNGMLPLVF